MCVNLATCNILERKSALKYLFGRAQSQQTQLSEKDITRDCTGRLCSRSSEPILHFSVLNLPHFNKRRVSLNSNHNEPRIEEAKQKPIVD